MLQFRADPPTKQRRVTVLFRLILVIPHLAIAAMYYAILLATFFGWFAALFIGRNPFQRLTVRFLQWDARVSGYMVLLTDKYPPLSVDDDPWYPVGAHLEPGRQGRWSVFFRLVLAIPAFIVCAFVSGGLEILAIVSWFIVLITGRLPAPIHGAFTATLRFNLRVYAYFLLVQNRYPRGLFGDRVVTEASAGPGPGPMLIPELGADVAAPSASPVATLAAPAAPDADDVLEGSEDASTGDESAPPSPHDVVVSPSSWTLALTKGAKRIIVLMMAVGVALAGLQILYYATRPSAPTPARAWATAYAGDITDLRNAVFNAEPALAASKANWAAISNGCQSVANAFLPLDSVPQYPVAGPDHTLLVGAGLIADAVKSCNGSVVLKSDAAALPKLTLTFERGERDLTVFLTEIPGQSV